MAQQLVILMGDASSEIDYRILSNSELIQKLLRSIMNSQPVLKSANTSSRWDKKPSSGI